MPVLILSKVACAVYFFGTFVASALRVVVAEFLASVDFDNFSGEAETFFFYLNEDCFIFND